MTMVRQTKQRTAVIEVLQASRTHPDAAQVHAQVREKLPSISLGTVYRTLDALVRDGMVTPIERVGQATRYDYRREGNDHHHALCHTCGAIFDVPVTSVPPIPHAHLPAGFQVTDIGLEFMGVCPACTSTRH